MCSNVFWRQWSRMKHLCIPCNMSPKKEFKGRRPFRISVEGNIGSGKSTFLDYFSQFPFVETYSEPLEKWRDVQGHNLLELLYEDMNKWGAVFQSYVQLTRTQIQTSVPKEGVTVQIFERSVQNNRYCFLENALLNGTVHPAQYSVLCEWFEWIQKNVDISLDLIVYLKTSPEVVYNRVLNRNRSEEKGVTLEYLEEVHNAHEKWLGNQKILKPPVFEIDADKCFQDVILSCQKQLPVLFSRDHSWNSKAGMTCRVRERPERGARIPAFTQYPERQSGRRKFPKKLKLMTGRKKRRRKTKEERK